MCLNVVAFHTLPHVVDIYVVIALTKKKTYSFFDCTRIALFVATTIKNNQDPPRLVRYNE